MLNRTIYSGLSYLLAPVAVARLYCLSGKHPGYRQNIAQRFGFSIPVRASESSTKTVWLHAVSVGEVIASEPFVKGLLSEHPQLKICLTTTTPTGAEQVGRSFADAVAKGRIEHCYAPYDVPVAVERFLDYLTPCALVVMETELWPNWIAQAAARNIPSILINGRLSEKSARGYKKLGRLAKEMMSSISCISAQTDEDASRYRDLGANRVVVNGNLKSDFELSDSERNQAKQIADALGLESRSNVLIAASTHKGEDGIILDAFARLRKNRSDLKLLLVPRHPDRASHIASLAKEKKIGYRLRSEKLVLDQAHSLVICDLLGELRGLYGLASIAIMGGTLVNHGGHNPLEPAAWGLPLVAGPSQRNFNLAFSALEKAGAMLRVDSNSDAIVSTISPLLEDEAKAGSMGQAALGYLNQSRGATRASLKLFNDLISLEL